jgi:uncharacterized delta-60 repeat protein
MTRTLGAPRAPRILCPFCSALLWLALASGCGGETIGTGGTASTTDVSSGGGSSGDECSVPSDCPDPGEECVTRLCLDHRCGTVNAAFGTPTAEQEDGDCRHSVCDGNGAKTSVDDDDTLDDGKQCTLDVCKDGVLTHDPAAIGAACSEGGGSRCDGAGTCVDCITNANCTAGAVCAAGACVSPTCADGVKNGTEVDIDCGGSDCARCDAGKVCGGHPDCKSGLCAAGVCATTDPIIVALSAAGHDRFFNTAFDAQGNIYAVGVSSPGVDTMTDFATVVARLSPQGVLDKTFGANGFFTKNLTVGTNGELARAIGFQSTGKIVIAATVDQSGAADPRDRDVAVLRLDAGGTLDTTFGSNGVAIMNLSDGMAVGAGFITDSVWHLVVQPDDKIVFSGGQVRPGGTDTDFAMVRLLADGAVDNTFGTAGKVLVDIDNANASARSVTLLPDGSLIGAGYMDLNGAGAPVLYKVNSSGVLDPTFATGGVFNAVVLAAQAEAYAVAVQGNKLVTTGYGRADAATESLDWVSLRFLPNGKLDPTYGNSGVARVDVAGFNDQSRFVLTLPDNRVVLAGGGRPTANNVDGAVGVLTPNGQPDATFSPSGVKLIDLGGANDFLWGVALAPSKDYLVLAGIKGIAAGGAGNDDMALVLVPIK